MPYFAFILKCRFKDDVVKHYVWQYLTTTKKEAEKRLKASFEKENIYGPINGKRNENCAVLEELIEFGEAKDDIESSTALYEAACIKADKLDAKINKAGRSQPQSETIIPEKI